MKSPLPLSWILSLSLILSLSAQTAPFPEDSLTRRQQEILRSIASYAPWDCPERWLHELGSPAERNRYLRQRMLSSVPWVDFLALANALDWSDGERRRTVEFLTQNFLRVSSGRVRQNIIFLLALTAIDASRVLNELLEGPGRELTADDRKDVRCALTALGDGPSLEWFIQRFETTEAFVGRPVFNFRDYTREQKEEGNRVTMRSYGFWEVLFRQPYFKPLNYLSRAGIYQMNARRITQEERDALAARLLPVFITKWHGHPGCDDAALRLMNFAIGQRDLKEIYLWAQRTSLLPDQDCSRTAVRIIKTLADSQLSLEELDLLLNSEDGRLNRDFLLYQRFLKTTRNDVGEGLEYFDGIALGDRSGIFAAARKQAARVGPSAALRDGMDQALTLKIIRHYPQRSRELAETPHEPEKKPRDSDYLQVLTSQEKEVVLRTRLDRSDSVHLQVGQLAAQYRQLLELKHLEKLEAAETDRQLKADLRYRQGKFFYREWGILFPIWTRQNMSWGYALNSARYDAGADGRLEDYVRKTFALLRAHDIFASIQTDYPEYRGMHNVAFHLAQSHAKLMDYGPAKSVDVWVYPDHPPPGSREEKIEYGHRRVGELFQAVVEKYPESEWADAAEKGAAWRLKMATILRVQREKAEKQARPRTETKEY